MLEPWLKQERGIFWITGKAGSGKSTFMKHLTRHTITRDLLASWAGENRLIIAEHHFWYSTTNDLQRSTKGLLRGLLYTVLYHIPHVTSALFPIRWARDDLRNRPAWTKAELMGALRGLSAIHSARFAFFIDGLDECIPSQDHGILVRDLKVLAGGTNVKLCLSSRPWQIFETHFGSVCHQLVLQKFTYSDMVRYTIAKLRDAEIDTGLRHEFATYCVEALHLVKRIVEKAEGVWLWTILIVRALRDEIELGREVGELQSIVDQTPADLKTYFTKMIFERIDHRNHPAVARLLTCATLLAGTSVVGDESGLSYYWYTSPMTFLNFSIFASCDEAENPDFALRVKPKILDIKDLQDMLERTRRYIGRMSRDLLYVPRSSVAETPQTTYTVDEYAESWHKLATIRVEFLHRSVLDYLLDSDIQSLLNRHIPDHFKLPDFLAHIALARAQLQPRLMLLEAFPRAGSATSQRISTFAELDHMTADWNLQDCEDVITYLHSAMRDQNSIFCQGMDRYYTEVVAELSRITGQRPASRVPWEFDCYRRRVPFVSQYLVAAYETTALTWAGYAQIQWPLGIEFCRFFISFGHVRYAWRMMNIHGSNEFAAALMHEAICTLLFCPTAHWQKHILTTLLKHKLVRNTWVAEPDMAYAEFTTGWWVLMLRSWQELWRTRGRIRFHGGRLNYDQQAMTALGDHVFAIACMLCRHGHNVFAPITLHTRHPFSNRSDFSDDSQSPEPHSEWEEQGAPVVLLAELLNSASRRQHLEAILANVDVGSQGPADFQSSGSATILNRKYQLRDQPLWTKDRKSRWLYGLQKLATSGRSS